VTSFGSALQFLTILRLRSSHHADPDQIARSQAWFAAVGLLLGLLLLGVDRLATRALPDGAVAALLVVALAVLTGALHLDGLADCADALGGRDRKHRLEIMRDVHAGTFAIVAVVSVFALKWGGFASLPSSVRVEAIVLAPCLARFAMIVTIAACPYARPEGLGAAFRAASMPGALIACTLTAVTAAIVLLGLGGLAPIAVATACGVTVGAFASRLLGGVTGDVYGATVEISEAVVLLAIVALANRGWLDAWAFG
jgi:adenosylcobinamide-GDP ribazoletransferase